MNPIMLGGDITELNSGIICHQVNCKGVMGAGLALQIKRRHPQVFDDYLAAYRAGHLQLGNVVMTKIRKHLYVASICGQDDYGRDPRKVYTIYHELLKGLERVVKFAEDNQVHPVYVPFQMGCGLANGDWPLVKQCMYMASKNIIVIKRDY